jgi:hypothetical protein
MLVGGAGGPESDGYSEDQDVVLANPYPLDNGIVAIG